MSNNYRAIQVLSVALANQIAAGEVIERPASCIKELLENSLDAGATEIRIDIDAGGMRQITVTDNGSGIEKEELKLALTAHATSKIQVQQDLFQLTTLGFRGEALASIQAVSKVEMISKRPGEGTKAYKLIAYQENAPISEAYFAGNHGTMIVIKDLFYNVPARKKFLKSAKTEYQYIESLVTALALSRPEVAIYFNHNQKQVYFLPAALNARQLENRISKLLGKKFIDHAIALNCEKVGLKLTGFLGLPETFLRTNNQQYFYINGRLIKDKLIMHAIKSFFQEKQLLGLGLYPAYVLYLTINPEDVDVNVHPTKHEVRFHEPRLIHDFITTALSEVMMQTGLLSEKIRETEEEQQETQAFKLAFNPEVNSDFKSERQSELKPAFKPKLEQTQNLAYDLELKTEPKTSSVFLKKPSDPSYAFVHENPEVSMPVIKIAQYLLWGESIEQPGQGRILDLESAQADILNYFLNQPQSNWFFSKPLLVPLTVSTRYTEQWLWPERQRFFETQFGLLYQFKQKNELLITHLPQIAKYLTHEERTKHLSCLFELALHNGQAQWQKAMGQFFPPKFLSRLLLEDWHINSAILEDWHQKSFCRTIERDFLGSFFKSFSEP